MPRPDGHRLLVAASVYGPALYFLGLAALAIGPLLAPGDLFALDAVTSRDMNFVQDLLRSKDPVYYGRLPLAAALEFLSLAIPERALQRVLPFGAVALSGIAMHRVSRDISPSGALFAGTVYAVNPFTYVRIVAGHWWFLLGYALLPLAVVWFSRSLGEGRGRRRTACVTAVVCALDPHAAVLVAVTYGVVVTVSVVRTERPAANLIDAGKIGVLTVGLSAYWLAPALVAVGTHGSKLVAIPEADLLNYAPSVDVVTALFSIASMHGFWRGGFIYARDLVPATQLLFVPVLFLAVYGLLSYSYDPNRGGLVQAVAVTALAGFLLGAGVHGPAAPLFRWAFEHVPLFSGMRDSQKFVALLALAYAYLGGMGLGELETRVRSVAPRVRDPSRHGLGGGRFSIRPRELGRLFAVGVVALAILVPLVYTFPMITGYAGQVGAQDYPRSWHEVRDYLDAQPGESAVLFLPWHQYMDYGWLERPNTRTVTPARVFFHRPVVQGDNVEIGPTYSTSTNPVSRYVEALFGLGPRGEAMATDDMGELLTHVDVKYVLLTKEADWRTYDGVLENQSDLSLVLENDHFRVYRNHRTVDRAYATNRLVYVEDLDAFIERSRHEDTTESVYVIDGERSGEVTALSAARRGVVRTDRRHLARYRLGGTSREYTVFVQHQATYSDGWRYDGAGPTARHVGMHPVYASSTGGGAITDRRFYRVTLPSYLVSMLVVAGLVAGGILDRRGHPVEGGERVAGSHGRRDR